jgi:hypothetical protein
MLDGVDKLLRVLMKDGLKGVECSDVFLACSFWIARVLGVLYSELFRSSWVVCLCGRCLVVEFIQSTIVQILTSMNI